MILFINLLFQPQPQWLGIVIVTLGVFLFFSGFYIWYGGVRFPIGKELFGLSIFWSSFLIVSLGLGISTSIYGLMIEFPAIFPDIYVISILTMVSWLSGVGSVRTYVKILIFLQGGDGESISDKLAARIKLFLVSTFIVTAGVFSAIILIQFTDGISETFQGLLIIWTISIFLLAVVGFAWKTRYLSDDLHPIPLAGFILLFAGSQIHNFSFEILEVVVLLLQGLVYSVAYIYSISAIIQQLNNTKYLSSP